MTYFSVYILIGALIILPVMSDHQFQRDVRGKMGNLHPNAEIIIALLAFLITILIWPLILVISVFPHDK